MKVDKDKLKKAIEIVREDLGELESCIVRWDHNLSGSKEYRPIARRIIASAQRLKALVAQYTYSG